MSRFDFNEILLTSKADITDIMNNFHIIESKGALLTDVSKVQETVTSQGNKITSLEGSVNTLNTNISGKAPNNHAVNTNTYGLGTDVLFGHLKLINNLSTNTFKDGEALSAYQGYVLNNAISGKSPTNHASSATTYGVGTTSNYGHTKIINDLTKSAYADGEALSAYQGKVLNDKINGKQKTISYGTAAPNGGSSGDIYIQYF